MKEKEKGSSVWQEGIKLRKEEKSYEKSKEREEGKKQNKTKQDK